LGPVTAVTSYHHQPEAQHPQSSNINNAGRLPHLLGDRLNPPPKADMAIALQDVCLLT